MLLLFPVPNVYKQLARVKENMVEFALGGYRTAPAFSALRSPFGLLETLKASVVDASFFAKDRFVEQLQKGTPM